MLSADAQMNVGNYVADGKVKRHAIGMDARLNVDDENPILDNMFCEVEFPEMTDQGMFGNTACWNLLPRVNDERLSDIIDHWFDEATVVSWDNAFWLHEQ